LGRRLRTGARIALPEAQYAEAQARWSRLLAQAG
jgi:hypothetical protein